MEYRSILSLRRIRGCGRVCRRFAASRGQNSAHGPKSPQVVCPNTSSGGHGKYEGRIATSLHVRAVVPVPELRVHGAVSVQNAALRNPCTAAHHSRRAASVHSKTLLCRHLLAFTLRVFGGDERALCLLARETVGGVDSLLLACDDELYVEHVRLGKRDHCRLAANHCAQ